MQWGTSLRKIGWGLALVLFGLNSSVAQAQTALEDLAEEVCDDLQAYVGKSDEAGEKWIRKSFCDVLTLPNVRGGQLDTLKWASNLLKDAKIRPSNGFLSYLQAVEHLLMFPDSALWQDYHHMIAGMCEKRSWKRDLPTLLMVSPALLKDMIIFDGKAAQWRIENAALGLDCDTLPIVHFTRGTLVGMAKGDTVRVEATYLALN